MRQTTHCVACQTQISVGEPTCWACGAIQAQRPSVAPPLQPQVSDPYHRPCPRCQHAVAVYHRECRNCGHALGRSTNTLPAELPSGWEATPLADGSVLLKRTTWNQINHRVKSYGYLLGVVALLALQFVPTRYSPYALSEADPHSRIATLIALLVLATLTAIILVWIIAGTECWRVGRDVIEIQKECLGRRWGNSYTQAELLIRCEWRTSGRSRQRVCSLLVRERDKEYLLSEVGVSGALQLQALGSYLSAQTGWPLQLPVEWPPVPLLCGLF